MYDPSKPSLRRDLSRLRSQADDLLDLAPMAAAEGVPDPGYLLSLLTLRPTPGAKFATQSDSRLWTYAGPVLGIRQLLLYQMAKHGEPTPPAWADAPPKLFAIIGLRLDYLNPRIETPDWVRACPAVQAVHAVVDAWADSGLGLWAWPAFALSHVPLLPAADNSTRQATHWTPLTPELELPRP